MHKNKIKVLIDTIQYLQELITLSGMKDELVKQSKNKTINIYEEINRSFSTKEIKKILNLSEQKILNLKTSGCCNSSLSGNCLKQNPNQISLLEQNIIKYLLKNPDIGYLPFNHIYSYALRNGLLAMSQSTFYKYAKKLGFKRKYKEEKYKVEIFSPKAMYPFQILHMDSTYWRCENGERVHIHFIQDNFSKKILGSIVDFSIKSKSIVQNLSKVIEDNRLQDKILEIYCDDGPENKKEVNSYLYQNNFKMTKVVANYKTRKSNNIIEAWNKTFKRII